MDGKKSFGLIIPKRNDKFQAIKSKLAFGSESDDDTTDSKRPKIFQKKFKKEETLDPSIYEYDEIYDEMKAKQVESTTPKEKRNSRYIETLLKAADKRKMEYERRVEKKIQVEREKEGDKYKDKESFVTTSYKKKMEEREKEEERERHKNMLNDMMDVTKQKDLSGFYRHFLKQTVGEEKIPAFGDKEMKEEIMSIKIDKSSDKDTRSAKAVSKVFDDTNIDRDSDGIEIDDDSDSQKYYSNEKSVKKIDQTRFEDFSDDEEKDDNSKHKKMKFFNIESKSTLRKESKHKKKSRQTSSESMSSDSEEESVASYEESSYSMRMNKNITNCKEKHSNANNYSRHDSSDSSQESCEISINHGEKPKEFYQSKPEKHTKPNIFIKRTVGDVFAQAQARYFQRMNNKGARIS